MILHTADQIVDSRKLRSKFHKLQKDAQKLNKKHNSKTSTSKLLEKVIRRAITRCTNHPSYYHKG